MDGARPGTGRVVVRRAGAAELPLCLEIRRRVFIEGQGVPAEIEIDGRDATSVHFVATMEGLAVGTARLRAHEGAAKVERVAVLPEHRGEGVGRALMDAVEADARARAFPVVVLHAQEPVAHFYERLGYRREGPVFLEAAIPHVRMTKPL